MYSLVWPFFFFCFPTEECDELMVIGRGGREEQEVSRSRKRGAAQLRGGRNQHGGETARTGRVCLKIEWVFLKGSC